MVVVVVVVEEVEVVKVVWRWRCVVLQAMVDYDDDDSVPTAN